jgi:SAM-dependent methyltransferase
MLIKKKAYCKMTVRKRDLPLVDFLEECNKTYFEKKILDYGAGGSQPPLVIFYEKGYETYGIDSSAEQVKNAKQYAEAHNMTLNIIEGDMRELPFEDMSFSFAYSHHTIHHMKKLDIKHAIAEMIRVLIHGGLLYINVPSVESSGYGEGIELAKGEFKGRYGGIHSFFEENEADDYFTGLEIIKKQKRINKRTVVLWDFIGIKKDSL